MPIKHDNNKMNKKEKINIRQKKSICIQQELLLKDREQMKRSKGKKTTEILNK